MDPLVTTGLVTALILVIVGGYFLMRPEKNRHPTGAALASVRTAKQPNKCVDVCYCPMADMGSLPCLCF